MKFREKKQFLPAKRPQGINPSINTLIHGLVIYYEFLPISTQTGVDRTRAEKALAIGAPGEKRDHVRDGPAKDLRLYLLPPDAGLRTGSGRCALQR
jgi:hypothetical protein